MSPGPVVLAAAGAAAAVPAGLRWLRVAQREHYLVGSVTRFSRRWWLSSGPLNAGAGLLAVAATIAGLASWWIVLVAAVAIAVAPLRLSPRGRTSPLRWTRRLATLATTWAVLQCGALAASWALGQATSGPGALLAGAAMVATPLLVELAVVATAPLERRLAQRWVDRAVARLERLGPPTVIGITGSYGKTTTKGYVAHLLAGRWTTVASPASFNNAMGLARTVNEHLPAGTEVLVAEMGAFGPGEIDRLCSWMKPRVGVITALGPVHLERFGSEERIARAKGEILGRSEVGVCNVDHPRLRELADATAQAGKRIWRCSSLRCGPGVSVALLPAGQGWELRVEPPPGAPCGDQSRRAALGALRGAATNVACAVAVALEMDVPWELVLRGLADLPGASHRLSSELSAAGIAVLDDTYNSNPAGAVMALEALHAAGAPEGRKVLVTPGMVELGNLQAQENAAFARRAAAVTSDVVVVGSTNRRALLAGLAAADGNGHAGRGVNVVTAAERGEAVSWVRANLAAGDAVLYENDLPDHFP
ncbi:MAG: Mur ligase family protein [Acidimicrobiales bacterium]